jgi:hypothetical protein
MRILRIILSFPFVIIAVIFFFIAEIIRGDKLTYRKKEVIAQFKKKHGLWER